MKYKQTKIFRESIFIFDNIPIFGILFLEKHLITVVKCYI